MNRRLPVTMVGGFFGAGKTSLLHYFICEHQGGYLAVLVENPGALNLDAKALRGLGGVMGRQYDSLLEIPGGDVDAQLEWMSARLKELAQAGRYERVLMEIGGATNPARLAKLGELCPGVEIAQVICVIDALDFYRGGCGAESEKTLRIFQEEQISGAGTVVLNKCDLVSDSERQDCTRRIRLLNPTARIIETAYGELPAEIWAKRDVLPVLPSRDETGPGGDMASALYRVHRPFHPGRFWDWFNAEHPGLLRVKGLVWLASRNLLVGGVSRTRWQNSCGAAGIWWAALPREEWPQETEALRRMQEMWREPYGDRRQELVLIGNETLLSGPLRRELDACLLTAGELARPVEEWRMLPDPFPAWDLDES
ncbi:MAG: GTP-binding protein [Methylacidiphilales bacterium]|nr:GTP-binding protein [Candidatus Methylacidiphilales bacterium]